MITKIDRILNIKNFFKILQLTKCSAAYTFDQPSRILVQTVFIHWMKSIYTKTYKHFPVFINKAFPDVLLQISSGAEKITRFGIINYYVPEYDENTILKHNFSNYAPNSKSKLQCDIIVPEQDIMQYFIQWQRYRKYWWSSITTTPSLFTISDIKYGDKTAAVNITAQFHWGQQPLETVSIDSGKTMLKNTSCLRCSINLENVLFVLLLDGFTEEYLKLHRDMAPYKISYALDCEDPTHKQTLKELATLLYTKLESNKISNWLPNFSLPLELQLKENLQMGVPYTAILSVNTLSNGIFHLLSSSTMLKEQVHVADFDRYASILCRR